MRRLILAATMLCAFLVASAQDDPRKDAYIVKTKNAKNTAVITMEGDSVVFDSVQTAHDFVSDNFKYYSLCDWKEGMRFMVIPEKYDLIVKTFSDASTGKEVSSMSLRHKIMVYKGHEPHEGHDRILFQCEEDGRNYYYEIPGASFDDYCYSKLGVPTLAYLGDVDVAKDKLIGRTVYAKGLIYRIDTEYDGDGYKEVQVPQNEEVVVTAVGVGSRAFPVKIIVEDKTGREFYQIVAISKTNCGMRDDEFTMDSVKHTFYGAFELADAVMAVSTDMMSYRGKVIHTMRQTTMLNEKQNRQEKVTRMMEFTIEAVRPLADGKSATLTLKDNYSAAIYYKDVLFITEKKSDFEDNYFGVLFAMGPGKLRETTPATRAAIREHRVTFNMTEDEVLMSVGDPDETRVTDEGTNEWIYKRTNGTKLLHVHFGVNGRVLRTSVTANPASRSTKRASSGSSRSGSRSSTVRRR